jgi:carbamoyltransferase
MKDILNLKIKRRESFRPVRAVDPARGGEGLVRDRRRRAFMMQVFKIKPSKRKESRRSPMSTARAACRP